MAEQDGQQLDKKGQLNLYLPEAFVKWVTNRFRRRGLDKVECSAAAIYLASGLPEPKREFLLDKYYDFIDSGCQESAAVSPWELEMVAIEEMREICKAALYLVDKEGLLDRQHVSALLNRAIKAADDANKDKDDF